MAMAGFAILLAEFALSGRFRGLSRGIGMDLTMRFHQWMALAALGFLIAHPILYTDYGWRPGPGGSGGAKLTPAGTVTGALAWLLLVMLVFFAWARRQLPWSYEAWRLSHGLGALLVPSRYGRRFDQGHFLVEGTHLFVSAGIGADAPPLRLWCPPELVVVDLLPATSTG